MFRIKTPLILVMVALLSYQGTASVTQANNYRSFEHWYLGLSLGTTKFYGDVSTRRNSFSNSNPFSGDFYSDRNFMYGLSLTKKFSGVFWTKMNLLTGTLSSSDENQDYYFKSDIVEVSASGILNLTDVFLGNDPQRPLNVYAYAGLGILSYRAWIRQQDTDSLIDTEGTGHRKALNMIIPLGIGAEYRVTGTFTVTGEFSLRNLRADNLDAHASVNTSQEGYGYINLGLHYQFDMPEGLFRSNHRYNGKSTDPAIRAYNKRKANIMKTDGYRKGLRVKKQLERERKEWLIFRFFKKTHLDMATE
ncbi:MAG TPA: hypothetical protein P5228_07480 [Bacteroidales bacterium]|nr:hypothetical protein [Bacteroidales bacterium]HRZ49938.1 hypothetical protein [Bacteroidales bacterium]